MTTETPFEVWLKFESPEDEEATYEANTYKTAYGYRVEWYHAAVGLVTCIDFDTLEEAHAWYKRENFQDFTVND